MSGYRNSIINVFYYRKKQCIRRTFNATFFHLKVGCVLYSSVSCSPVKYREFGSGYDHRDSSKHTGTHCIKYVNVKVNVFF